MKILPKIILLFAIPALTLAQCLSEVSINTDVPGSYIYVDGNFAGNGNVKIKLSAGSHYIRCVEDIMEWDSNQITDSLSISECHSIERIYYFNDNRIRLETTPQNAAVFADGKLLGYTPTEIEPDNISRLLFKKKNYFPKSVDLRENIILKNIDLEMMFESSKESFVDSDEFVYLIGSTVAFGISAAYFKLKADNKYDEYSKSLDKSLLDETESLDIYSGIATTLLQINIGYIVYRLVTD